MKHFKGNRREFLKASGLTLFALSSPFFTSSLAKARTEPLTWATGQTGTFGNVLVFNLCRLIREKTEISIYGSATGGWVASTMTVGNYDAELCFSSDYTVSTARQGLSIFENNKIMNIYQIFLQTPLQYYMLTRKDTNIYTIEDLEGKQFGGGGAGTGSAEFNDTYFRKVRELEGINVRLQYMAFAQHTDALIEGRLDAISAYVGGRELPGWIEELVTRVGWDNLRIVPFPERHFSLLKEMGYSIGSLVISDEDFGIDCPYINQGQFARSDIREDIIYAITKAIYDNIEETYHIHPGIRGHTIEDAVNRFSTDIPVHPGAARYFIEKGVWREELVIGEIV